MRSSVVRRGSQYDMLDDPIQSPVSLSMAEGFSNPSINSQGLSRTFSQGNGVPRNSYIHASSSPAIPSSQMLDDLFKWVWGIVYKVHLVYQNKM